MFWVLERFDPAETFLGHNVLGGAKHSGLLGRFGRPETFRPPKTFRVGVERFGRAKRLGPPQNVSDPVNV